MQWKTVCVCLILSTLLFNAKSFASSQEEIKKFPAIDASNVSCFVENEKVQPAIKTQLKDPYCCQFTHQASEADAEYRPVCLKQHITQVEALISAVKKKVEKQELQLQQELTADDEKQSWNYEAKLHAYNFCPHWAKDNDGNVQRYTAELTRYLTCLDSQYTSYQRYLSTVQEMQKTFAKKERKK